MRGTARQVIVTAVELESEEEHDALVSLLIRVRDESSGKDRYAQRTAENMLEAMEKAALDAQELRSLQR